MYRGGIDSFFLPFDFFSPFIYFFFQLHLNRVSEHIIGCECWRGSMGSSEQVWEHGDGRVETLVSWLAREGWEPFFYYFEFLLTIYLFHFSSFAEKSKWSWHAGEDRWWEHLDGSMGMAEWGWEHGDSRVETLASWCAGKGWEIFFFLSFWTSSHNSSFFLPASLKKVTEKE